jgi:hypothetical protein
LNPALAYQQGGASTTSGATASATSPSGAKGDVDTSATAGVVSLLSALLQAQVSMSNQMSSAVNNLAVADKYNETSKYLGELSSRTSLIANERSALASEYASRMGYAGSKYFADTTFQNVLNQLENAKELQSASQAYQWLYEERFPSNQWSAAKSLGKKASEKWPEVRPYLEKWLKKKFPSVEPDFARIQKFIDESPLRADVLFSKLLDLGK